LYGTSTTSAVTKKGKDRSQTMAVEGDGKKDRGNIKRIQQMGDESKKHRPGVGEEEGIRGGEEKLDLSTETSADSRGGGKTDYRKQSNQSVGKGPRRIIRGAVGTREGARRRMKKKKLNYLIKGEQRKSIVAKGVAQGRASESPAPKGNLATIEWNGREPQKKFPQVGKGSAGLVSTRRGTHRYMTGTLEKSRGPPPREENGTSGETALGHPGEV